MTASGETEVEDDDPLIAGVIHGVRKWGVGKDRRGNPRLLGYSDSFWQPEGRPTVAACLSHAGISLYHQQDEPAPASACSCGLYAHHPWARRHVEDYNLLSRGFPDQTWLVGVVEAWGQLEVHKDGFRAQFARPILLIAAAHREGFGEDLLDRVAAEYRCFAGRVESARELRDLFGEVNRGLDREVVVEMVQSIPPPAPPPWSPPPPGPAPTWSKPRDWPRLSRGVAYDVLGLIFDGAEIVFVAAAKVVFGIFAVMMWLSWIMMCGIVIGGCGAALIESF